MRSAIIFLVILVLSNALIASNLKKKGIFGELCFESEEPESDTHGICYTVSLACLCTWPVPIACSTRRGLRLCCQKDKNGWCAKNN